MRMAWAGLALRLLYMTLAHTYRLRTFDDHFEFGWEMGRIARALATGHGYAGPFNGHSGPSAWCPPLYPLLLAGCFKLFGVYTRSAAWAILAINCIFSAFTAPAVYQLARRAFAANPKVQSIALWSGWLWALYPAAMQYAVKWVWDMSLTTFLFAWVLVLALQLRAAHQNGRSITLRWAAFGALWGLIALSNASLLAFLPACGLWMILPHLRRPAALRNAALAAACCLAVMTPWIARNLLTMHHFIPMRDNLGAELYESVRPTNDGFPWGATVSLATASPQFQRYQAMGEWAYSAAQGTRAKAMIAAHPARFARYMIQRVDFFWVSVPHPLEFDASGHASPKSLLVEAVREANYAIVSVAGLLGLALALHRRVPGAWLFFWAVALIPLIYYVITVQARFRHPLEPILLILAVYLFQSAEPRAAARTQRRVSV